MSDQMAFCDEEQIRTGREDISGLYLLKRDMKRYPVLSQEEAARYSFLFHSPTASSRERREAREALVCGNLRLVFSIAMQFAKRAELADLVDEGTIGLLTAVGKYDSRRGKFSTYAACWIRQACIRYLYTTNSAIRIPEYMASVSWKVDAYIRDYTRIHSRGPSAGELARVFDRNEEVMRSFITVNKGILPLSSCEEEEGQSAGEGLCGACDPEAKALQSFLRPDLLHCLGAVLSERERLILCLRYGLDSGTPDAQAGGMTLSRIGERLHLTQERIRQIEKEALLKLKASPYVRQKLQDYL